MNRVIAVLLCPLLFALSSDARAVTPLGASDLKQVCDAAGESAGARLCVVYVNGFLDGAVATDARVAENVAKEAEREETFTERAIRTRVIRRLEVAGPTGYAEFCVGEPVPILEVVAHVRDEFANYPSLAGIEAQSVVYAALRRHYPCDAES